MDFIWNKASQEKTHKNTHSHWVNVTLIKFAHLKKIIIKVICTDSHYTLK